MPKRQFTVSLDFDGVLHEYRDGWENGKIRGPVPGAEQFLKRVTAAGALVMIHSCRPVVHIRVFLMRNDLEQYISAVCPPEKPRAELFVDDKNWPGGRHFDASLWGQLTQDVLLMLEKEEKCTSQVH